MVKGIIWDFNGTLFDDSDIHVKIWEILYKELCGDRGDVEHFKKTLIGTHNKTLLQRIYTELNEEISEERSKELSKEKERRYREYSRENNLCHLVKGAKELLDECKERNIKMVICSTSIIENIDFYFSDFGLDRWFDKSLTVYDHEDGKEKSIMYKEAAKNIGLDIGECLVFEDSDYGVKSALDAGAKGLIILDKKKRDRNNPRVLQVVSNFDEVDRQLLFA